MSTSIDTRLAELLALTQSSYLLVNPALMNIDDLSSVRPGGVIRCRDQLGMSIQSMQASEPNLGCIAGWISDDEGD